MICNERKSDLYIIASAGVQLGEACNSSQLQCLMQISGKEVRHRAILEEQYTIFRSMAWLGLVIGGKDGFGAQKEKDLEQILADGRHCVCLAFCLDLVGGIVAEPLHFVLLRAKAFVVVAL